MDRKIGIIITGIILVIVIYLVSMALFLFSDKPIDGTSNSSSNETLEFKPDSKEWEEPISNETVSLEDKLESTKENARTFLRRYEYNLADEVISDWVVKANIDVSELPKEFQDFYYDIPNMAQLKMQYEYGDLEGMKESIENLSDVENFFIAYMEMDYEVKTMLTKSSLSILTLPNCKFENLVIIPIIGENDVTHNVAVRDSNVISIHQADFIIDDSKMTAIIARNNNGFYIYTIESDNPDLLTIDAWNDIMNGNL